jgi:hypothetical protein
MGSGINNSIYNYQVVNTKGLIFFKKIKNIQFKVNYIYIWVIIKYQGLSFLKRGMSR